MKPTIRCSKCENEIELWDKSCEKCGERVDWPREGQPERAGRGAGRRDAGDRRRKPTGTGLSPSGKLVTGVVAVVVVAAVIWQLSTDSSAPVQSRSDQSVPPLQAPMMGQGGSNMDPGSQLSAMENQVRQNPGNHELALQVANFAHDNGYYDKAIAYYDQYLEHHPDDVNAIVDKGICFHELQRSDEAIAIMQQALKIQPNHLQANFNLGIINLQLRNLDQANEWFTKVVQIAPNSDIGRRAQELLAPHANLPPQ